MTPDLHAWMHPGDLFLYELDLLPWPAYTQLVECYFAANGYRVKLIASDPGRTAFILVSSSGVREVMHCCTVQSAQRLVELDNLRSRMARYHVLKGILVSPNDFSPALLAASIDGSIDLYSGNRLRASIEALSSEVRRTVLDSIRPEPDAAQIKDQYEHRS